MLAFAVSALMLSRVALRLAASVSVHEVSG